MTELDVGVVAALYRYPVKSMQGEALQSAQLRWTGLDGDRQYAFYRAADKSRFPWHTGREVPDLVRHIARYADPADTRRSPVQVTTPDGASFDIAAEELRKRLSDAAGEEVRLLQVGRGTFDSGPVSVISTATEAKLDRAFGAPLGLRRFRPNIVIRGDKAEIGWLGGTLVFGERAESARLRLNRPIERCAFITIDPDTAAKDTSVMRMVVQDFNNEVGAYGATDAAGTINVGDRVRLVA
ncbi:MAG TPA: MOSC N-terminal beta barrel domain-containing protein [Alphaproteobacteria bacterium]|nr:MOSC N-terminal beta barrel domain-containing protein [Alphaproteobacteria bacterium]